jgi:hypothetical protein
VSLSTPSPVGALGSPASVNVTVTTGVTQQPGGCPTINDVQDSVLIFSGLNMLRMTSGSVSALPLPNVSPGRNSGSVLLGETTISPDPVTIEMTISKCKGQIDATSSAPIAPGCYVRSQQRNFNKIDWIAKPMSNITQETADRRGWCYSLESEGVRYVNVRYTYASCQYAPCGFAIQSGDGPL